MRWSDDTPQTIERPRGVEWLGAALRVVLFLLISGMALFLFGASRLVARFTGRKQAGGGIVRFWATLNLWCCGLTVEVEGETMRQGGALVANHVSWIDILTLHSVAELVFVSKAEVGTWPFIGFLARATNTVFIERRPNAARRQQAVLQQCMADGQRLCFFPEGTSTDGTLVLPFKSSLFGALHRQDERADIWVQPASVVYLPRKYLPRRFYSWWGDMEFGEHLLSVFGKSYGGRVRVVLHPPVKADSFPSRKQLAAHCEKIVRDGFHAILAQEGIETGVTSETPTE